MGALFVRELDVALRSRAFAVSAGTHGAVLTAWILTWGEPVTAGFGGAAGYRTMTLVQAIVLTLLLPWTAARCSARTRGDDLVLLAAMTARRPSEVLAARVAAVLAALLGVVSAGLPATIVAVRMSAVPILQWLGGEAAMAGIAVVACGCAVAWQQQVQDRLVAWIGAEVSTITAVTLPLFALSSFSAATAVITLLGVGFALLLIIRSDRTLRYLSEQQA